MKLVDELGIRHDAKKSRADNWWGFSPFSPGEQNSSFHLDLREGQWFCHATNQGGGPIELVQRARSLDCYNAGRWLVEQGVSWVVDETRKDVGTAAAGGAGDASAAEEDGPASGGPAEFEGRSEKEKKNEPIRVDLRKLLSPAHPELERRGIPPEVLLELGAGYLEQTRGPLKGRLVFQVRGLQEQDGDLRPVILSHVGRALTQEQEDEHGKWYIYKGFRKSCELYNIDLAVLDAEAVRQAQACGHVILVEGCFDVAKLWAAGIRNVVATFGSHLLEEQLPRIELIRSKVGVNRFLVFFDRDQVEKGTVEAVELLRSSGFEAEPFRWDQTFPTPGRGDVPIPESIMDPCEFSVEQLMWLKTKSTV